MTIKLSGTVGFNFYFVVVVSTLFIATQTVVGRTTPPSPQVDVCLVNTDCTTCITQDNCGFCQETGLCLTGDVNGPGGNPNNCTEWFFLECPSSPCSALTSCKTCLADSLCGWCFTTQICEPGSKSGPVTGTCQNFAFGNPKLCKPSPSHSPSHRRPSRSPSHSRSRKKLKSRTPFPSRSRPPFKHPKRSKKIIIRRSNSPFPIRRSHTPFPSRIHIKRTKIPITTVIHIRRSRRPIRSRSRTPTHSRTPSPSPSIFVSSSGTFLASKPIYIIFYLLLATFSIGVVTSRN